MRALVPLLLLCACDGLSLPPKAVLAPKPAEGGAFEYTPIRVEDFHVVIFQDKTNGATCYLMHAEGPRGGISCVPPRAHAVVMDTPRGSDWRTTGEFFSPRMPRLETPVEKTP